MNRSKIIASLAKDTPISNFPTGSYTPRKFLGRGAFGEVWQAEAPGGVEVAVKIIHRSLKKEEADRELEALQLIKRLRHPFLLALQAFFPLDDRLVIVLELADRSVRARLEECERAGEMGVPAAELLHYLHEAAEALDYLHENQLQHRDVKPDNLLLLGSHIKIADYGLARMLEEQSIQTASTVGTPAYMPPEVWNGKVSQHSDQYSLATSYVELRTGSFPFAKSSLAALINAHLNEPPDLSHVGEGERDALTRALAKEPGDRFPSCGDFVRALQECASTSEGLPPAVKPAAGTWGTIRPAGTLSCAARPVAAGSTGDSHSSPARELAVSTHRRPDWRVSTQPARSRWRLRVAAVCILAVVLTGVVWKFLLTGGSEDNPPDIPGSARVATVAARQPVEQPQLKAEAGENDRPERAGPESGAGDTPEFGEKGLPKDLDPKEKSKLPQAEKVALKVPVKVLSNPEGAAVRVEGEAVGVTPLDLLLAPGNHRVTLLKQGYQEKQVDLKIHSGAPLVEVVRLEKLVLPGEGEYQKGLNYYLGMGQKYDRKEALRFFKQAAEKGHVQAQGFVGLMLCNEYGGGHKDEKDGAVWIQKSREAIEQMARLGEPVAQTLLGLVYSTGSGITQDKVEAVKWFRKAAEQGFAGGQNSLGVAFAQGTGTVKDEVEAVKWYRKAADQEYASAQNNLAVMYATGRGVAKDDVEAVRWYRKAADQQHPQAQNNLGLMYVNGRGVAKDDVEAVKWYRKSADQNLAQAQYQLARMYAEGRGVAKDEAEAAKWCRKAAEHGITAAQNSLGSHYANGRGVAKDDVEAVQWYRKAAEQGNAAAQNNLGWHYANGRGVAKDEVEAVTWYRKAVDQKHAPAQNNLGVMYATGRGVVKDEVEAVTWYRKAADQNHALAQNNLGWMYATGRGVVKDDAEAVTWYRKSADQKHALAQNNLGVMYATGRGVAKDEVEAVKWYRKAAEQAYPPAQTNMGYMYEYGRGVTANRETAIHWYQSAADKGHAGAQSALQRLTKMDETPQPPLGKFKGSAQGWEPAKVPSKKGALPAPLEMPKGASSGWEPAKKPAGSKTSLHLHKRAADFYVYGVTLETTFLDLKRYMAMIFDHTENYEIVHHGPHTATGGPHLHIGRYGQIKDHGFVDFKTEGLTVSTQGNYARERRVIAKG